MNDELFNKLWKQFIEESKDNDDEFNYPTYVYEDQMNNEMLGEK